MRISRDKLNKLAHTVADTLADIDEVGFLEDRNTIRQEARKALEDLLTEEGLPHFHRLLATYLGGDTFWSKWTNLWTAEEDRHGAVLHDYTRDSKILDNPVLERMQARQRE